jgi:tRNA A37 threonylcarbamoyltransferase TsaD
MHAPQMEDQMAQFVSNRTKGLAFDVSGGRTELVLSRIFLWFRADFGGTRDDAARWLLVRIMRRSCTGRPMAPATEHIAAAAQRDMGYSCPN